MTFESIAPPGLPNAKTIAERGLALENLLAGEFGDGLDPALGRFLDMGVKRARDDDGIGPADHRFIGRDDVRGGTGAHAGESDDETHMFNPRATREVARLYFSSDC